MNKTELVESIADTSGIPKQTVADVLDAFAYTVTTELAAGNEVALTGFGKWTVSERGARVGRNPATGQEIEIAATKTPKFSAGAQLKSAIKGS
jgi:DNA-binding protein HU-beta